MGETNPVLSPSSCKAQFLLLLSLIRERVVVIIVWFSFVAYLVFDMLPEVISDSIPDAKSY